VVSPTITRTEVPPRFGRQRERAYRGRAARTRQVEPSDNKQRTPSNLSAGAVSIVENATSLRLGVQNRNDKHQATETQVASPHTHMMLRRGGKTRHQL